MANNIATVNDGDSLGDHLDPEEHAYTEAYRAVSNIYTANPLEYETFVKMLDQTFGEQDESTRSKDAISF